MTTIHDMTTTTGPMLPAERNRLEHLEDQITTGMAAFRVAGAALQEIRDTRLYRGTHATFEDYAQAKWGMGGRRAYQLIQAATVAEKSEPLVRIPNERVAREVAKIPERKRAKVLKTLAQTGVPLTAAAVRKAAPPVIDVETVQPDSEPLVHKTEPPSPTPPESEPLVHKPAADRVEAWWNANRNACLQYPAIAHDVLVKRICEMLRK